MITHFYQISPKKISYNILKKSSESLSYKTLLIIYVSKRLWIEKIRKYFKNN